jgi:hypothetical protein
MRSFCLPIRQPLIELSARHFEPKQTRRHAKGLFDFQGFRFVDEAL